MTAMKNAVEPKTPRTLRLLPVKSPRIDPRRHNLHADVVVGASVRIFGTVTVRRTTRWDAVVKLDGSYRLPSLRGWLQAQPDSVRFEIGSLLKTHEDLHLRAVFSRSREDFAAAESALGVVSDRLEDAGFDSPAEASRLLQSSPRSEEHDAPVDRTFRLGERAHFDFGTRTAEIVAITAKTASLRTNDGDAVRLRFFDLSAHNFRPQ